MVRIMASAGCKVINFGVESMDTDVLKLMNKKQTLAGVASSIKLCTDLGIATTAYYMVGNEGETYSSYLRGLGNLINENPTLALFSIATAYPGTDQYKAAVSKGYLKDPKWYNNFSQRKSANGYLELPGFTIEQQIKAAKMSTGRFFLRPSKILEVFSHFISPQFLLMGGKFLLRKNNQYEY